MADTQTTASPVQAAVEATRQTDTTAGAPTQPAQAAEVKTEGQDPRLEAFARKERQLRKQQQALQMERQAWEAKQKQYETDYMPKSRIAEDPLGVLSELGLDYNKLTEMLINNPTSQDPTIRALRNEIKALRDEQVKAKQASEEAVGQQYQQALKQINNEVKMLVDSDPEYETIKSSNAHEAVTQLIEETFKTEGYLMDITEAAKEVENYLIEEAYKMAQSKKVQSRLMPKTEEQTQPPKQQQQATPKTITNSMQQQQAPKRLSEKERRERALAAFHGKLKE